MSVSVDNQFDVLSTPRDESKDSSLRSLKDDVKEQAWQTREGLKNKATQLKEQVVDSSLLSSAQSKLQSGLELAKSKITEVTGVKLDGKSNQEIVEDLQEAGQEQWETVKRKGNNKAKKAAEDIDQALDEKLTPAQRAKLNKGVRQAKQAGQQGLNKANSLLDSLLSAPQLRGVRNFINKNNLQLPAMILLALGSLWLGLTLIRLVTSFSSPARPEFDIHDAEASKAWLKYHAGEYKGRALEAKETLSSRVANFLSNHNLDQMKADAIDYKEIGMKRLGLAEPTYSEQLWGWVTGRPVTWQGRVQSALDLAKKGIKLSALKAGANKIRGDVRDNLGLNEPSLTQRVKNYVTGHDDSLAGRAQEQASILGDKASTLSGRVADAARNIIPGLKAQVIPEPSMLDKVKASLNDGLETVRAHIPGSAEAKAAAAAAQQRAYDATHHSTLDNIKSGAEYVKNRIVHGAEEAAHIAQDRAQRLADEAKYKTGL